LATQIASEQAGEEVILCTFASLNKKCNQKVFVFTFPVTSSHKNVAVKHKCVTRPGWNVWHLA